MENSMELLVTIMPIILPTLIWIGKKYLKILSKDA